MILGLFALVFRILRRVENPAFDTTPFEEDR